MYKRQTLDNGALKYNRELASEYITCLKQMQQDFDLDYDIKVSTLSRYPEVLVMEEQSVDEEALWESLDSVTGDVYKRQGQYVLWNNKRQAVPQSQRYDPAVLRP